MDALSSIIFEGFSQQDVGRMVVVAILLLCSALISGSETSFFSLSPQQINNLKDSSSRSEKTILRLLKEQDRLLATILIVNNLVNIGIVILCNAVLDSIFDFGTALAWEFVVKMIMVTFLLLLFGEIMPKIFAAYNPIRFARLMALPLLVLRRIFQPISWALIRSSNHINETVAKKRVNISIDELSNAIEMTNVHSDEEKQMLSGIVNFVTTEVVEIMKSRVDMVALERDEPYSKVREVVVASGFSRIPIYEESIDNIKGVLYVKDLLPYLSNDDHFEWQNLLRKPYFIPEHKKINELLAEFQTNQVHLAIVVDEYGSTQGLVSLEDILEEIVGEIADESDVEHEFYKQVAPNIYLFEGKTHINDLLKVLGKEDDFLDAVKGEAETVAGLMLEIRRDFLKPNEVIFCKDLSLRVEAMSGRRIDKVRVEQLFAAPLVPTSRKTKK